MTSGLTLDAGALIAVQRRPSRVHSVIELARTRGGELHVIPEVLAQAWRGGPRQARLAQFLKSPDVVVPVLDRTTARLVGELCGISGHHDVVDVHVVLHARMHGHRVLTSDAADLRRVDPHLPIIEI